MFVVKKAKDTTISLYQSIQGIEFSKNARYNITSIFQIQKIIKKKNDISNYRHFAYIPVSL